MPSTPGGMPGEKLPQERGQENTGMPIAALAQRQVDVVLPAPYF